MKVENPKQLKMMFLGKESDGLILSKLLRDRDFKKFSNLDICGDEERYTKLYRLMFGGDIPTNNNVMHLGI